MNEVDKYTYDARKKTLYRVIKEKNDVKIGEKKAGFYVQEQTQEYSAEGVELIFAELKKQKHELEKVLEQSNKTLDATQSLEDSEELKELREKLQQLKELEGRHKAQEHQKYALEQLSVVNGQMNKLKAAVGQHLKLK